jgi:hypothetical protein
MRGGTTFLKSLVDNAGSTAYVVFVMIAEGLFIADGRLASAENYAPSVMFGVFAWLAKRDWI